MARFPRLDIGRALLALALATALWWVIVTEQNPERTELFPSTVPVEVVNSPPNLVITSEAPSIQVQVRAPADVWARLRSSSFRATADAARGSPGSNELNVRLEPLDPAVRELEPVPARISVVMEETKEKSVPVRVNLTGAVSFGYSSGSARVLPETVTVSGPDSAVQRTQEALVEIPIDQLTLSINSTYQPVPVDARRERVPGVKLTPPTVTVEVPITQNLAYREVGVRPIIRGRLAPGYYLEPVDVNPPSATIVGNPSVTAPITSVETEPIDVSNLASTTVRQVFPRAPAGVSLLQPRPVNVTLRVSPIQTTQTVQISPVVTNLGPDLRVAGTLPTVELTISGPAPTLQNLSSRDFRVVLDLAGRGTGQHSVDLSPQIPQGLTLDSITPAAATVALEAVPAPTPVPGS